MTRLATANPSEATGPVADYFAAIKKSAGKVPNLYATIGSLSPDSLASYWASRVRLPKARCRKWILKLSNWPSAKSRTAIIASPRIR